MKNTIINAIIHNLFGKFLAIAFLSAMFAVASHAQTKANIYYQQGGAFYGTVYAYSTHFEIYTNGTVIKTFANSCKPTSSGGVAGVVCSFGQFRNGQHIYSGWGYFFKNAVVYLMWTNENTGGQWRQINTPWYAFRP